MRHADLRSTPRANKTSARRATPPDVRHDASSLAARRDVARLGHALRVLRRDVTDDLGPSDKDGPECARRRDFGWRRHEHGEALAASRGTAADRAVTVPRPGACRRWSRRPWRLRVTVRRST